MLLSTLFVKRVSQLYCKCSHQTFKQLQQAARILPIQARTFITREISAIPEINNEKSEIFEKMKQWEKVLDQYSVLPTTLTDITELYKKLDSQLNESTQQDNALFIDQSNIVSPKDLTLKTMKDSYCELWLPFTDVPALYEEYVDFAGFTRIGKILQDLDRLAGAVAYKHTSDQHGNISNITIVTAAVDRIDIIGSLECNVNYKASGVVSYVGFSSMEISLKLEKALASVDDSSPNEKIKYTPVMFARFTMVARNKDTGKAIQINPLRLESHDEKKLFKITEEIKREKTLLSKKDLVKNPPNQEESRIMHNLWIEAKKYQDNKYNASFISKDFVWLDSTKMNSVHVCFPQERNIHNKVFGGFLMRMGHELAYANACMFSGTIPESKSLDDFSFTKPVNIGSILRLTSQVVYSSRFVDSSSKLLSSTEKGELTESHVNSFQVAVIADVLNPKTESIEHTNTFHFSFATNKPIKRVIPRTYEDMVKYIEGRRRNKIGNFISNLHKNNT
ncbi:hypothetical protein BB561_004605 [Smittium simulii]|uniref:HotDog ACOT-type domain-containing protein n=1 Tax=Smittium simulii TaxID=133385 RepID=A0A2T9YF71_9FUNG|nr:hypothetical protein BB561_004605 [Smittium simulii]